MRYAITIAALLCVSQANAKEVGIQCSLRTNDGKTHNWNLSVDTNAARFTVWEDATPIKRNSHYEDIMQYGGSISGEYKGTKFAIMYSTFEYWLIYDPQGLLHTASISMSFVKPVGSCQDGNYRGL